MGRVAGGRGRVPGDGRWRRHVRYPVDEEGSPWSRGDEADGEGGRRVGASAAETVREIEDTRARLEAEFTELERRLPAPTAVTRRLVGLAIGGGAGTTAFWFVVRRMRKRAKK